MNWLLVMMIWMATPGMSTNLFWTSLERPAVPLPAGDFSAAEKYLRANGLALKRWAGAGFGEPAGKPPGIWLIVAGPKKEETDAASLAQLDDYLKAGGSVLILIRSDAADAGIRSLLR
ncbi:MAG TPA: hypothetical protein VHH73_15260, partial [Verrucomicrobiae bacterium]|nr:hypothetical protein [Verrucomicrobiae bacterium]